MKILIMGLPGSGKTWLAKGIQYHLNSGWINADVIRKMANDYEFSEKARIRQALRIKNIADFEIANGTDLIVADFVCPTKTTRSIFNADFTIWMNTIDHSRYEDTNLLFEKPINYDIRIDEWIGPNQLANCLEDFNHGTKVTYHSLKESMKILGK